MDLLFAGDRRGGPWVPPAHLPHRPVAFGGNTGATLAGHWFPAERPRGVVVLVHPDRRYGKHWFVKEGWVELLHAEGYDVLCFDLAGYGESRGPAKYYHDDVLAAARFAQEWSGGFPVHVVGVSLGAFAVANASPRLDFVESLVLESPYPSFSEWYGAGPARAVLGAMDAAFPRTARALRARENISRAGAKRILVALAEADEVTRPELTERVAAAAPPERTRVVRVREAKHLEPFAKSEDYRRAILDTLAGRAPS